MADASRDGALLLENESDGAPVVTQVLGRVEASGARVEGVPESNSTRWILDVECAAGATVDLFLLDPRSGQRVSPKLMSFSISPLDADCVDAKPHAKPGAGRLTIYTRVLLGAPPIHYRVAIDAMHSATR